MLEKVSTAPLGTEKILDLCKKVKEEGAMYKGNLITHSTC